MSKAVVHVNKYTSSDTRGIMAEDFRLSDKINSKNDNLDLSRTKQNYCLVFDENEILQVRKASKPKEVIIDWRKMAQAEIDRLDLKRKPRKDAITVSSFIIGADTAFFERMGTIGRKTYFNTAMRFFKAHEDEYGKVLCGSVHLDEATPHMHLRICPITSDGRLSAKSLYRTSTLRKLQKDFYEEVAKPLGMEKYEEGKTVKHLDEVSFKIQEREKQLELLNEEIRKAEAELADCKKKYQQEFNALADVAIRNGIEEGNRRKAEILKSIEDDVNIILKPYFDRIEEILSRPSESVEEINRDLMDVQNVSEKIKNRAQTEILHPADEKVVEFVDDQKIEVHKKIIRKKRKTR